MQASQYAHTMRKTGISVTMLNPQERILKMRNIVLARTLLAVAALMGAAAASAQEPAMTPGGPGFGGMRPPMERSFGVMGPHGRFWNDPAMIERLKLTDDQRKGMDQILQQHRTTLVDLHANLEKSELALEPMMNEDQPNETRILAQIDEVAQARTELEKANARFLLAIRAKLSSEQWKGLQAARAERAQQFRNGMMRRSMPGQGAPNN